MNEVLRRVNERYESNWNYPYKTLECSGTSTSIDY